MFTSKLALVYWNLPMKRAWPLSWPIVDWVWNVKKLYGLRTVAWNCGYRIHLLVEDAVIVELKAVNRLEPIHQARLITYLKLSGCQLGLLINFNVKVLKHGIRRLVNGIDDEKAEYSSTRLRHKQ